jgi:hypothetical protein
VQGRARFAVQAHLADVLAGAVGAVGDFAAAAGVAAEDAQAAGQDDVERVADVAFVDQQRALAVLAQFAAARQVAHGGGQFGDVENVA